MPRPLFVVASAVEAAVVSIRIMTNKIFNADALLRAANRHVGPTTPAREK